MQHQTFKLQLEVFTSLWNILQDVIKHFKKQPNTLQNAKLRSKAKNHKAKLARTNNIMKKRDNIETRGYDTNATITRHAYRKIEATLEQENAAEAETVPTLIHLHPKMQEYEQNLPEPEIDTVSLLTKAAEGHSPLACGGQEGALSPRLRGDKGG